MDQTSGACAGVWVRSNLVKELLAQWQDLKSDVNPQVWLMLGLPKNIPEEWNTYLYLCTMLDFHTKILNNAIHLLFLVVFQFKVSIKKKIYNYL